MDPQIPIDDNKNSLRLQAPHLATALMVFSMTGGRDGPVLALPNFDALIEILPITTRDLFFNRWGDWGRPRAEMRAAAPVGM